MTNKGEKTPMKLYGKQNTKFHHALMVMSLLMTGTMFYQTEEAKADPVMLKQGNTANSKYVDIPVNKAAIVSLPAQTKDVIVANPEIVDVVVRNPKQVYMFAKKAGQTNAFFFDKAGNQILNLEINIGWDSKKLELMLTEQLPGSNIKVSSLEDNIILSGTVNSASQVKTAKDIAEKLAQSPDKVINNIGITGQEQVSIRVKVSEMRRTILKQLGIDWNTAFQIGSFAGGFGLANGFNANGAPTNGLIGTGVNAYNVIGKAISTPFAAGGLPSFPTSEAANQYGADLQATRSDILSQINDYESQLQDINADRFKTTPSYTNHQTLIDDINASKDVLQNQYNEVTSTLYRLNNQIKNSTAPNADGTFNSRSRTFGFRTDNFAADSLLRALERHNLVKTLAEPNLTALSGESAKFLAGGELPFFITSSFGQASVDFKPYGIGLAFTPVVLNEGRISLKVSTEVSDIDTANGISSGNATYPAFSVRRAETTVELPSGGSIVLAGLIEDSSRRAIDSTPGVKDIPVLGPLFRSNDFKNSETELVIIATPYLVNPTHNSKIKLPTDGYTNPSDLDMYLNGRMSAVYSDKNEGQPANVANNDNSGQVVE